jgi:hypothetical protein
VKDIILPNLNVASSSFCIALEPQQAVDPLCALLLVDFSKTPRKLWQKFGFREHSDADNSE